MLATLLFRHWDTVNLLVYESSLAKYEVMTGERGPVTYLVFHTDLAALENITAAHDEILGVEQHDFSNVAKMAFQSADSPLITKVEQLAVVTDMISRHVPMLCH